MAVKAKPEPAAARPTGPVSLLSQWVRQGTESFFATQKILLDLVMRQNANTIRTIREKVSAASAIPVEAVTEVAGEGISNFIAAQRVLLHFAQRENEILMTGLKERTTMPPIAAMADLYRRGVDTFIDMQQNFLTLAAKRTDEWIDAAKEGRAPEAASLTEMAREAIEDFVRSQKKFLDVVAEETAHMMEGTAHKKRGPAKRTELTELGRQAAEAFIDAQKKLLDVAAQQMEVNVKVARKTMEMIKPLQPVTLADLTRQTVDSLVAAQKALLDVMAKPVHEPAPKAHAAGRKAAAKPGTRRRPVVVDEETVTA